MRNTGGHQRETLGGVDDLARSLRESCGATCLLYGFFDPATRAIEQIRQSVANDCPEELRKTLFRAATTRASVCASLHSGKPQNGSAEVRGVLPEQFPIWTTDGNSVIGIGKPVAAYFPIIAFCNDAGDVTTQTKALMRFALAFVSKALTEYVYSRPVWPEGLAQATLKLLSIGYFVVTKSADIEIDGRDNDQMACEFLGTAHNRLSTPDAKERLALSEAIRLAAGEEKQTSVVSVSGGGDHLKMVLVAPFDKSDDGRALVLFETKGTDHFALREHFFRAHSITRSEAQVAHEVLHGKTVAETSSSTGLSLETVRSYLKQVFYKTGTHRQSELIALYYSWSLPVGKSIAAAELRRRN